jgi:hypothetical protein
MAPLTVETPKCRRSIVTEAGADASERGLPI